MYNFEATGGTANEIVYREMPTLTRQMTARIWSLVVLLIALLALSACNSGSLSEGLESVGRPQPGENVGNQTASNQTLDTPAQGQATLDPTSPDGTLNSGTQTAALPSGTAVAFLPVSNAPQSAVGTLAKSIRDSASRNGLPIVASVQQGAQYQVKGYFSALEDGSGTLLVYVWDVLDRNNKRVYRINGQEQSSSKSTDPWSSVSPQMLERVADNTVAQLQSWLSSR